MISLLAQIDLISLLEGSGGTGAVLVPALLLCMREKAEALLRSTQLKDDLDNCEGERARLEDELWRERRTRRYAPVPEPVSRSRDLRERAATIIAETHAQLSEISRRLTTAGTAETAKSLGELLKQFNEHFRARSVEIPPETEKLVEGVRSELEQLIKQFKDRETSLDRDRVNALLKKVESLLQECRNVLGNAGSAP